jgi:hypothetical protein
MGGRLTHRYLRNTLLLPSEWAAADRIRERPKLIDEMADMLKEIDESFIDGYDPSAFVRELSSLQALDAGLRDHLLAALRREYLERFRPEERLGAFRRSAVTFLKTFQEWNNQTAAAGVNTESAPLWETLQRRAMALHDLLEDRELSTRWIP